MPKTALQALKALLDREYEVLLTGALDQIAAITAEKEALLRKLPQESASPAGLQKVSSDLARNQALLVSAQKGVKAAELALNRLDQAQRETVFYDRSGTVSRIRRDGTGLSEKL